MNEPAGDQGMHAPMTRQDLLRLTLIWGVALVVATCTPAAVPPAPTSAPAKPTAAPGKPAAAPAKEKAQADWEAEWERTLQAAKGEGRVAVLGPPGVDARDALTGLFQQKFGIEVEFQGGLARDLIPRLTSEREAGQHLWDLLIQGAQLTTVKPMGITEPIEPTLILPEVKDPQNWRGGALEFTDQERHILVMVRFQQAQLFVNSDLVRQDEIKSYKDILDSKWRGRIIMDDPRRPGPGQACFTFLYMHPELGPDFIRALAQQEPVIMADFRQEGDAIGQGRFPILLGGSNDTLETLAGQGAPIRIVDPTTLREGSDVSPANGEITLLSKGPHPNAAKVYLNWLLSKEGQTEFVRALKRVSARADVPTDHTFPWRVPQPGSIKTYTAEARQVLTDKVLPLVKEVFGET